MPFPKGLRALNHRDYRLFWTGQLVSLIGTWMQSVGQSWLVLELTNSPFKLGLIGTLQFGPVLFLSFLAGAIADRVPKRRLVVGTQTALMLQAFILAALAWSGHVQYWHVAVLAAGTSDLPVAEEAAVTADVMGNRVDRLFDVGVAGLHRLLREHDRLRRARVVVVVAGMEGALPSVVAGLVQVPVIAVPTSIGYGASFGGLAALLGMLNSCASGVSVVNIDNGFGADYAASQINSLANGE